MSLHTERNATIVALRLVGYGPSRIASLLELTDLTVTSVLNKSGVLSEAPPIKKKPKKKQKCNTYKNFRYLTKEQVKEIKETYVWKSEYFGACALARKYKVAAATILKAVRS